MSSRVCGGLDSAMAIVSKLMKLSEYSLLQNQLSELHNMLADHRKLVANEEFSSKKQSLLLETDIDLAKAQNLALQKDLKKSQNECQDLKRELARLRNDEKMWSDSVGRTVDKYSRFYDEINAELNKKVVAMEELVKDRDSIREECFSLQSRNAAVGIEKSNIEDELERSRAECNRLSEEIRRMLREEERVSGERARGEEERYAKFLEEQSEITKEKDKVITELNKKVAEMEWREKVRKDSLKQECLQLKSTNASVKLGKLKFEDELKKSREECADLKGKLERSREEERGSRDRVKRAEEIFSKLYDEQSKKIEDLQKQNSVASDDIKDLKSQILNFEADKFASDQTIERMRSEQQHADRIIKELKDKQLEDNQAVEEVRRRNSVASGVIKELKNQISASEAHRLASDQTIEKMRCEQLDADRIIEELKGKQPEDSEAADAIEELKNQISAFEADKLASDQTIDEMRRELLDAGQTEDKLRGQNWEASIVIEKLRNKFLALYAYKSIYDQIIKEMKHKQLVSDQTVKKLKIKNSEKSDVIVELRSQILAFEAENISTDRKERSEKLRGSGTIQDPIEILYGTGGRHGQSANNADSSAILSKKRRNPELSSSPEVSPLTFILRRKIVPSMNGDDKLPNYEQQLEEQIHITRESDRSFLDLSKRPSSRFTGLGTRNLHKTWMCQAEMLNGFQDDLELCMNAVCVLYRQKISEPESPLGLSGGFSHFEIMGGCVLAKYLIDGDPEHRLRKLVSEVEQERPDVLPQCRTIAMDYVEKLFSIYCTATDPFF